MADVYLWSGATGLADGSSWADAYLTVQPASTAAGAGGTVFVAHDHAETAGLSAYTFAGTLTAPQKIICVDRTTGASAKTATLTNNSSAGSVTYNGSAYFYGISIFRSGGLSNPRAAAFASTQSYMVFDNCRIDNTSAVTTITFTFGAAASAYAGSKIKLINTDLRVASAAPCFTLQDADMEIVGGVLDNTPNAPTFANCTRGGKLKVSGFDFSGGKTALNLVAMAATTTGTAEFINSKLPASWTGGVTSTSVSAPAYTAALHNCDSGDTNYRLWTAGYAGTVRDETTITRTGGASDSVTPLSWAMVSGASAAYPAFVGASPEIVVWNDTTGAVKTVTVEVLTDGITLKDNECWIEVQYLGTSGFPLGSFITNAKASVLATAGNQPTSTESWVTTGLTSPVTQKLSVTFTPQEKGFIQAKVMLAKPSTTVYVCPKARLT